MRFNLLIIIIIGFGFASGPNGFADDSGLAAYWPLDEGEGTPAQDLSGKGNAGKISGEITWEKTERGMALRFNGKNTSVRIPNSPTWNIGRGALTLCLWVKVMDNKRGYLFEHYFGGAPGGWGWTVTGTAQLFAYYDDRGKEFKFDGATSLEMGKWHHLAVVWSRVEAGSVQMYVNGVLEKSGPGGTHMSGHPSDLFIGSSQGAGPFFNGYMKKLAIFDRALKAAEIKTLYQKGIQLTSPLVISSLTVDKILYHPRENGRARVRVKNVSTSAQKVELQAQLPLSLELGSVARNLARQVEIAGVDVRLNVHATPSHVEELEADEVILATGSHPYIPSTIPRHEKARVFTLPEAMAHPAALGDSVLLVDNDGHQRGASAAGWLLGLGKKLKIVTEFTHVGCHFEFAMLHFRLYELLHRHEITVMPNYRVEEIHADTVDVADNYAGCRRTLSGHDSVIMIYPQIANTDLETSLRKTFPHLHRVGDCLSVRNIEIAVY